MRTALATQWLKAIALLIASSMAPASAAAGLPQFDESGNAPCCPSPRFLGSRAVDGVGTDAAFDVPVAITFDADDDAFYIADAGTNTIRRFAQNGRVTTIAGACDKELLTATCVGRELDGTGKIVRFDRPSIIAYDATRRVLVVYDAGSSALRLVDPSGRVRTLGHVSDLTSLAVSAKTGLWFAAQRRSVVAITPSDFDLDVTPIWTLPPPSDGDRRLAPVNEVNAVAIDPETDDVYASAFERVIYRLKTDADFRPNLVAGDAAAPFILGGGSGGRDGTGSNASFRSLDAMAFDPVRKSLLVVDFETIRGVSPNGEVRTVAGGCTKQADPRYRGEFACDYPARDGRGTSAHFGYPVRGLAVDPRTGGSLIVDRAYLRELSAGDDVKVVAGNARPARPRRPVRWNARYLDTASGETMDVFVNGDEEIEIEFDPAKRVYDVKRGLRSAAYRNAQFWSPPTYVRTGEASGRADFDAQVASLSCGPLADRGSTNPVPRYGAGAPAEQLFFSWYDTFAHGQSARYFESPRCAVVRVTDATGKVVYEDYESRTVSHAVPAGLLEYTDERL